ncbi:MAG TPA: Imm74 family immunity protein [Methylocella sp.]|nr:Imm74 family immunity protein [Methylocella sp.]
MTKPRTEPRITLTEGSIHVHWGEKILTILPASCPPNTEEPADFTVDLDSILTWDAPHDEIEIEVAELQKITKAIEEEFERLGLVVEFD